MDLLQSPVKSLICSYRPIMDASLRISAYEVVSRRDDDAQALHTDAPSAIISAFLHTGMNDLFSGRPVFVRATPEFLMSELPLLLPEKRIVFQLPAQETLPESYLERISTLAG